MARRAPARPALAPAIVFLGVVAWTAGAEPQGVSALWLAPPLGLFVERCLRRRAFDAVLLALACAGGAWVGLAARSEALDRAAALALRLPAGRPFEASWEGRVRTPPAALDGRTEGFLLDTAYGPLRVEVPRTDGPRVKGLPGVQPGARVRVWARVHVPPGGPRAGGVLVARVKSARLVETLAGADPAPLAAARAACARRLDRRFGAEGEARRFLGAVLLGEGDAQGARLERSLRATGLAHLLAISGLHVGWIVGIVLAGGYRSSRRTGVVAVAGSAVLLAFGLLVGWGTPVRRAVLAAVGVSLGRACGREGDALNRLACVGVAIGAAEPTAILAPRFLFSFTATAAILLVLARRPDLRAARIALAASAATAPLTAVFFGEVVPLAPLVNLATAWTLPGILLGGYGALAFHAVPWLGTACAALARLAFEALRFCAERADGLPATPLAVAPPPWQGVLALLGVAALAASLRSRRAARAAKALAACGYLLLVLGPPPQGAERPRARLIDVGQGQALWWASRGEVTLLDAGGRGWGRFDPGREIVVPELLTRGWRRLDRLVLSHGDADHAGGARALTAALGVEELWVGPGWWRSEPLADTAARVRASGGAVRLVVAGDAAADLRVLHAPADRRAASGNAGSLVLAFGAAPWGLLVPGDLDGAALDAWLAARGRREIEAPALVLAHHGSRHGRPARLLAATGSAHVLVSCGFRNPFGHPHEETRRAVRAAGTRLYRTDHHGSLDLIAAERGWTVRVERGQNTMRSGSQ